MGADEIQRNGPERNGIAREATEWHGMGTWRSPLPEKLRTSCLPRSVVPTLCVQSVACFSFRESHCDDASIAVRDVHSILLRFELYHGRLILCDSFGYKYK